MVSPAQTSSDCSISVSTSSYKSSTMDSTIRSTEFTISKLFKSLVPSVSDLVDQPFRVVNQAIVVATCFPYHLSSTFHKPHIRISLITLETYLSLTYCNPYYKQSLFIRLGSMASVLPPKLNLLSRVKIWWIVNILKCNANFEDYYQNSFLKIICSSDLNRLSNWTWWYTVIMWEMFWLGCWRKISFISTSVSHRFWFNDKIHNHFFRLCTLST